MSYNVTINNKNFELAKCTLDIEEKLEIVSASEKALKAGTEKKRAYVEKMYDYVESCMGEEATKEALSCTSAFDVDVKELEILVYKIASAYNQKIMDTKLEETRKFTSDMTKSLQGMKFADIMRTMSANK